MNHPRRLLMKMNLSKWSKQEEIFRPIHSSDSNQLGEVMYEAYKGTIDYSGESLEEACVEVAETLSGKYGRIISEASLVAEVDGKIVAAIIFSWFEKESMPLLTFTMTRASHKGKGLARKLLSASLYALNKLNYQQCCLVVTEGNEPAVSIYRSFGFVES